MFWNRHKNCRNGDISETDISVENKSFIHFIIVTIVTYLHSFHLQFCTLAEIMIKIFLMVYRFLIHSYAYSRYNISFVFGFFFYCRSTRSLKYHHCLNRIYYHRWQCKEKVCLPFATIKSGLKVQAQALNTVLILIQ